MSKYGHRTGNWFEAIVNRMGGEQMADRYLRGEFDLRPVERPTIKVWKRIKLGTFKVIFELERVLRDSFGVGALGFTRVSDSVILSKKLISVDLIALTVEELGFSKGAPYGDVVEAAKKFGLLKCPGEVGPQLRLQYTDQSADEDIYVAMDPVNGQVFRLCVSGIENPKPVLFTIESDNWLGAKDILVFTTNSAKA